MFAASGREVPAGTQDCPYALHGINTAMDTNAVKLLTLIGGFLYNLSPHSSQSVLKMMSLSAEMNTQIDDKCDMKYLW
jgi:hypothetical protein